MILLPYRTQTTDGLQGLLHEVDQHFRDDRRVGLKRQAELLVQFARYPTIEFLLDFFLTLLCHSSHRALWRTYALRAVGNLARALCRVFVPQKCLALFLRAASGSFDEQQALRELQRLMVGDTSILQLVDVKGRVKVAVPNAHKALFADRTSLAALQRVDMARFAALRELVLPSLRLPYAAEKRCDVSWCSATRTSRTRRLTACATRRSS
jgi:hypothetical protein